MLLDALKDLEDARDFVKIANSAQIPITHVLVMMSQWTRNTRPDDSTEILEKREAKYLSEFPLIVEYLKNIAKCEILAVLPKLYSEIRLSQLLPIDKLPSFWIYPYSESVKSAVGGIHSSIKVSKLISMATKYTSSIFQTATILNYSLIIHCITK